MPPSDLSEGPLPQGFVVRLTEALGIEEAKRFVAGLADPGPIGVRLNTLNAPAETTRLELLDAEVSWQRSSWSDVSGVVQRNHRERLMSLPAVNEGRAYPQALSSQWAVHVLEAGPGDSVLDLCAAPGGKTLHLAQCVGPDSGGRVAAVESSRPRFFRMKANLQRGGAAWVKTYCKDGRRVGDVTPERFDRVLVDAPCSAESALSTTDVSANADWSERKIRRCASLQSALLASALQAVRVGGTVVYATCTSAPEENEGVVASALERFDGAVELLPVAVPDSAPARSGLTAWRQATWSSDLAKTVRLMPGEGWESFFVAKLRKINAMPPSRSGRRV